MGVAPERPTDTETISVSKSDGWYVARDEETGISTQGETKIEALENLTEALQLYEEPVSREDEPVEESDAPWL